MGEAVSAEFCVVCGRTDRPLTDGVCAVCYTERHPLVMGLPHPTVTLCPTCGARLKGSHWERRGASSLLTAEDLMPLVEVHPEVGVRTVDWQESGRDPLMREIRGVFHLRFRGTESSVEVPMNVHVMHRTCPECSRRSGHYYTARIQLRGPEGRRSGSAALLRQRLGEWFDAVLVEARGDWKEALSWKEALPEGWDYYLTDTLAARALARMAKERLGGELKESASLYGRKDGREVYRVTLRLRVPEERLHEPPSAVRPPEIPGEDAQRTRRTARLRRVAH
jgi:60S ribosomal export protein NMD3